MLVLLELVEKSGEVVSRDQLLTAVWGEAVVGEENLTRAISELRRVFKDNPRDPQFVETIRNHGYRLLPAVKPWTEPSVEFADPAESAPGADPDDETRRPKLGHTLAIVFTVIVALALWALYQNRGGDSADPGLRQPVDLDAMAATPLTSFPGHERHPALSADGTRVAFVWTTAETPGGDLYIKQRNSEAVLRLTTNASWVAWPTWSPEGQSLAFVQGRDSLSVLCTIPSLGGPIRQLLELDAWIEGLDWSAADDRLVFSARLPGDQVSSLYYLDLQSLDLTPVNVAGKGASGGVVRVQPRFSPDGQSLAWFELDQIGFGTLCVASTSDSHYKPLVPDQAAPQGLAWTKDGQSLIYSAAPGGVYTLWRVDLDGGDPSWMPTQGDFAWNPTVARQAGHMVYEQVRFDQDLWQIEILSRDPWQLQTRPFISSTRWEYEADFSPDGRQVAFVSARTGSPEIWTCDRDGGNLQNLTSLKLSAVSNPQWSPDGTEVAFNAVQDGRSTVMLVQAAGGQARCLTQKGRSEVFSEWSSRTGQLLVGVDQGRTWQIVRRHVVSGRDQALTQAGGSVGRESVDGRWLFHVRPDRAGLWRLDLTQKGAQPECLISDLAQSDRFSWVVLDQAIAYVSRMAGTAFLVLYDLEDGHTSIVSDLPGLSGSGLAFSPQEDVILFASARDVAGDLLFIEYSGN